MNSTSKTTRTASSLTPHKRIVALAAIAMFTVTPITMTGCMGDGSTATSTTTSSSSSNANNIIQVAQTSYKIEKNATNDMCNGALKLAVTDMQRRPTSIFSGADISGSQNISGTNESTVGAASTTDIAIQVDISYTWNVNTYKQAITNAGGTVSNTPSKLTDVLNPGSLMYVQGKDADGNLYQTADIIVPGQQDDVNKLAINSQWDYDVLNSALPETSVTKTGSFLLRVASTASDLELIIITPTSGQDVTDASKVSQGNVAKYSLQLT